MNINTRQYFISHLVPPRWSGCWAFTFGSDPTPHFTPYMKYTDAKKWALKKARELGATEVNLLP